MTLEGPILGKFPCAGCGQPSRRSESSLVTKTRGCPKGYSEGGSLSRRGEGSR
jgi:hypothetical protein